MRAATAGPKWLEAALLAALLWPPTTVLVDFLYGRFTFGMESRSSSTASPSGGARPIRC